MYLFSFFAGDTVAGLSLAHCVLSQPVARSIFHVIWGDAAEDAGAQTNDLADLSPLKPGLGLTGKDK